MALQFCAGGRFALYLASALGVYLQMLSSDQRPTK